MTLLEKILEHKIHIDWDDSFDGPSVYCDGATSWKGCTKGEDLESAVDLCIKEKKASEVGLGL